MVHSASERGQISESVRNEASIKHAHIFLSDFRTSGGQFSTAFGGGYTQIACEISCDGSLERATEAYFDTTDQSNRLVRLGRLVLCPSSAPLKVRGASVAISEVLICRFENEYFSEMTGLRSWDESMLKQCGNLQSREIAANMRRMAEELLVPQENGSLAIEVLSNLVMIDVARFFNREESPCFRKRQLASWQLRKIENIFKDSINHWPSLSELAKTCRVSENHLSRAFSQSTGIPLSKFSERIRMDRARNMLLHSNLSIKEISVSLGFSDQNYFSTAFRRVMKISPLQFIRSQKR